jgi:hypothetical protein
MGVWQGVALDSLKFHPGPPYPTLLRSAGGPPLKWPSGHLLHLWTLHAACLWLLISVHFRQTGLAATFYDVFARNCDFFYNKKMMIRNF